jgi:phosphohistidine phosphatase
VRRLLILRHAKAGSHNEKHDKERQLIDRGRGDAALMGGAMREKNYLPQLVLCSSATRTKETWEHAAPALGAKPETTFLDSLYDATAGTILNCVLASSDTAATVLYIGHNPGLEQLARRLVREPQEKDERRRVAALMSKYPTGALSVIDFDVATWTQIAPGGGTLADFITPADLKSK